jgi:hypothetical protein
MAAEKGRSILDDIEISADIDKDMCEVASIYAYWSQYANDLIYHHKELKIEHDVWMATKKHAVVTEYVNDGGKMRDLTESAKEGLVSTRYNSEYMKRIKSILESEKKVENMKSCLKAIEMKQSMLISVGANRRQDKEFHKGTRINE